MEAPMPKHEPEVIAAVRRRKPIDSRVVLDDNFAGAARKQQVLCCPRCGYQYLHRAGSHGDSFEGLLRERHIEFYCESCGKDASFELVITEYKGNVFVEWKEP
jgi:transposase-like protein